MGLELYRALSYARNTVIYLDMRGARIDALSPTVVIGLFASSIVESDIALFVVCLLVFVAIAILYFIIAGADNRLWRRLESKVSVAELVHEWEYAVSRTERTNHELLEAGKMRGRKL